MRRLWLVLVVCGVSGCDFIRDSALKSVSAKSVLDLFNTKSTVPQATPPSCEAVVGPALRETLADAYFTSDALAPLKSVPLREATLALLVAPLEDQRVFDCLFGEAATASCTFQDISVPALDFPKVPDLASTSLPVWQKERDVQRVQHDVQRAVREVASSCRTLEGLALTNDVSAARIMLERAFARGLADVQAYQDKRAFHRQAGRAPVAWVLSGGAANGAFSAGAVWWLLHHHLTCGDACKDDRVDFVSGASTGTLIASVVKNYFAASSNASDRARELETLLNKYTCSTNRDLYCVQKQSVYDLLLNKEPPGRGLVRFDGLRCLMANEVGDEARIHEAPEQFASVVQYESGQAFHLSSLEAESKDAWVMALEGSLVEPLLAEPRKDIGTRLKGTFIDGGVRSGLPLVTPLRRGAQRSLVFANTVLDGKPSADLANAAGIALRTIDLFSLPPIVGELALAEQETVLRRQGEKERCLSRLGFDTAFAAASAQDIEWRCSQETATPIVLPSFRPMANRAPQPFGVAAFAPAVTMPATPRLERVEDGYRSAWLFMPRSFPKGWEAVARPRDGRTSVGWGDVGAVGYSFDPQDLWNLFALGVLTAQSRCREVSDLLGWHLPASCEDLDRAELVLNTSRIPYEAQCVKKDVALVECEGPAGPVMPPFSCPAPAPHK